MRRGKHEVVGRHEDDGREYLVIHLEPIKEPRVGYGRPTPDDFLRKAVGERAVEGQAEEQSRRRRFDRVLRELDESLTESYDAEVYDYDYHL